MKNKKLGFLWAGVFVAALIVFVLSSRPTNSITLDVNPSIEITTTRLNNVLSVSPLNKEATKVLEGFFIKDKDFDSVVNELVDLMVLTGDISAEKDNLIVVTANDNNANPVLIEQVNQLIAANLQNKQIEARLLGQTITYSKEMRTIATDKGISPGKLAVIKKITAVDGCLSVEELAPLNWQEILTLAAELDIKADQLFENPAGDIEAVNSNPDTLIHRNEAIEMALDLTGGGEVVAFELEKDWSRYEYEMEIVKDGKKYEVEIDAHTGKVLGFAVKDGYDKGDQTGLLTELIYRDEAIEIALDLAGGGEVVEFELEKEQGCYEYEIKIVKEGQKYEVEIDAHTGKVLGSKVKGWL